RNSRGLTRSSRSLWLSGKPRGHRWPPTSLDFSGGGKLHRPCVAGGDRAQLVLASETKVSDRALQPEHASLVCRSPRPYRSQRCGSRRIASAAIAPTRSAHAHRSAGVPGFHCWTDRGVALRGLIQTALNRPHAALPLRGRRNGAGRGDGWRVQRGTVIGALLFGLYHLINLAYQSLGSTVQQVLSAFVIGLVFGVLYDRTRNLVGASLAHSVADFSGTAIPLLAYFVANR